jgi:hypothetical protein
MAQQQWHRQQWHRQHGAAAMAPPARRSSNGASMAPSTTNVRTSPEISAGGGAERGNWHQPPIHEYERRE